jgi:hypothetical protein
LDNSSFEVRSLNTVTSIRFIVRNGFGNIFLFPTIHGCGGIGTPALESDSDRSKYDAAGILRIGNVQRIDRLSHSEERRDPSGQLSWVGGAGELSTNPYHGCITAAARALHPDMKLLLLQATGPIGNQTSGDTFNIFSGPAAFTGNVEKMLMAKMHVSSHQT